MRRPHRVRRPAARPASVLICDSTIFTASTTPCMTVRSNTPLGHLHVGHPRVVPEPDRVTGAAPRQRERGGVLPGHVHLERGERVPLHQLVLFQVVPVGLEDGEDGLGRRVRREPLPQHQDVEGVEAGCLQADVRGDLAGRVHLCHTRREEQSFGGELVAPPGLRVQQPVLFTGGVQVVAATARLASTTSGPYFTNGPTMLLTTFAPRKRSVSALTSCSTSTTSWSTVSIPGTLSSTSWTRFLSR